MKKYASLLLLMLLILGISSKLQAAELKLALLAPEGSAWHKIMSQWNKELVQKSGGQLKLKIYAGGVLGDEKDVIRKMQIGQVQMGGFTGLGLGLVNPEVRVLELPMMFGSYEEVDYVTKKVQPKLEKGFERYSKLFRTAARSR